MTLDEVFAKFDSSMTGLTTARAKEYYERDGPNILTPTKGIPEWKKFAKM